ncbi:MAG: NADH:ubiquinone reductase (Na(+)-transporting) subunit C [Prevotella sp.]|nr:NADH:ubiquinone reductase (Na(+)-transporting) subunit C [Prevotella sp.]
MGNENKKGLNTNSNVYTIIYSVILVVIVAFLLAFVSKGLEDKQKENVALDKKKQILYALNIRDLNDALAEQKYKEVVKSDDVLGEASEDGNENHGFKLNSGDYKAGKLAVFNCEVDGQVKYVIPVYGMGLWGAISGYVALDADKQTVFGAYFNHESETAGLGAEIKDNEDWQKKFIGKKLFKEDGDDIALSVMKTVDDPDTQVDAVTGATLTSDGVSLMLKDCLGKYVEFLKSEGGAEK